MAYIDITGQKFERLLVIEYAGLNKHNCAKFLCKCDCGNSVILCRVCNGKKSNKDLSKLPQPMRDSILSAAALFLSVWTEYEQQPIVEENEPEDYSDWKW
jgi:hypothetical protein